jgi:hypothetical protein
MADNRLGPEEWVRAGLRALAKSGASALKAGEVVALLGPAIEQGIAGFGDSVHAALRAFNAQYLRSLRKPEIESALTAKSQSASNE